MRVSNGVSSEEGIMAAWQTYEEVTRYLLQEFAAQFGLGTVEGKQLVPGASGTDWKIAAKAFSVAGDGLWRWVAGTEGA